MTMHNYYVDQLLGEERVFKLGFWLAIAMLAGLAATFFLRWAWRKASGRPCGPFRFAVGNPGGLAAYLALAPLIGACWPASTAADGPMQGRRGRRSAAVLRRVQAVGQGDLVVRARRASTSCFSFFSPCSRGAVLLRFGLLLTIFA
jgi:hypothetical protein